MYSKCKDNWTVLNQDFKLYYYHFFIMKCSIGWCEGLSNSWWMLQMEWLLNFLDLCLSIFPTLVTYRNAITAERMSLVDFKALISKTVKNLPLNSILSAPNTFQLQIEYNHSPSNQNFIVKLIPSHIQSLDWVYFILN